MGPNKSGVVKAFMLMVSFGLFFALMSAGRATVEPLAEGALNMIPFVQTEGTATFDSAWRDW